MMFNLTEGREIPADAAVYAGRTEDPAALADAMLALLDDPARCWRMGVEALFNWNDHRQIYLDAYTELWR